jgi:hypothetical protein
MRNWVEALERSEVAAEAMTGDPCDSLIGVWGRDGTVSPESALF